MITIPTATGSGIGSPTGTAYNGTARPGPGVNNFTFATLDGTISTWNAGTKPTTRARLFRVSHLDRDRGGEQIEPGRFLFWPNDQQQPTSGAPTYYASNFKGSVEAYDATTFRPARLAGKFSDPTIPRSYKPYGIQAVGDKFWVSFFNETAGGGFVDAFETSGRLLLRLAGGAFAEPWGMAQAPADFGAFSNMLLVGNTTSGMIGAYDPNTGVSRDSCRTLRVSRSRFPASGALASVTATERPARRTRSTTRRGEMIISPAYSARSRQSKAAERLRRRRARLRAGALVAGGGDPGRGLRCAPILSRPGSTPPATNFPQKTTTECRRLSPHCIPSRFFV